MTNILKAIKHFAENPVTKIKQKYSSEIRINRVGDSLEFFVKDIFAGTLNRNTKAVKEQKYSEVLSWLGNSSNPPDFIIKGGDAVEVKKIEGKKSAIPLNSSYPKNKLHSDDPRITKGCRSCEDWTEKDIIYAIGSVSKDGHLNNLTMIYGDCWCADKDVYVRVSDAISNSVQKVGDIELVEDTNELGGVRRVDPLGITYLRIRGMWGIENPHRLFDALDTENVLSVIIRKTKFDSFATEDIKSLSDCKDVHIDDIMIKDPNNPAKMLQAKYIFIKR